MEDNEKGPMERRMQSFSARRLLVRELNKNAISQDTGYYLLDAYEQTIIMADLPTNFGSVKFASVSFNQHQKLVAGTGTFDVDPAVARSLPEGSKVIEGVPWGTSAWTVTSKVRVQGPDGVEQAYFMKTAVERGAVMMEGEFNSLKTIRATVPLFAPEVYGWGKFDLSDTYFLLMDFLDLRMVLPDPSKICSKVVEMHQSSISPTGKFGFALPTCHGKHIQPNDWDTSWCRFFTRLVTIFFETDLEINGPWQEYEDAFAVLKSVVIPSLLEPLQSDGRVLKPCLIHGDLWEENMGIDLETGNCVVFDASVFYAHNEYELGIWRQPHQRIGIAHRKQYMRYMPPSEPAEQWDDRNLLYSIKFSLAHAAGWTGTNNVREAILENMNTLIRKYATTRNQQASSANASIGVQSGVQSESAAQVDERSKSAQANSVET